MGIIERIKKLEILIGRLQSRTQQIIDTPASGSDEDWLVGSGGNHYYNNIAHFSLGTDVDNGSIFHIESGDLIFDVDDDNGDFNLLINSSGDKAAQLTVADGFSTYQRYYTGGLFGAGFSLLGAGGAGDVTLSMANNKSGIDGRNAVSNMSPDSIADSVNNSDIGGGVARRFYYNMDISTNNGFNFKQDLGGVQNDLLKVTTFNSTTGNAKIEMGDVGGSYNGTVIKIDDLFESVNIGNKDGSNDTYITVQGNQERINFFADLYQFVAIRTYADHAAADVDGTLLPDMLYKLTGDRAVYQKP